MKKCPFCAEQIEDEAKICRWCHSDLTAPAVPPEPETSGMAIGSLITGIFFFFFPSAIAAVVLGHMSRARIRRSAGRLRGSGMALAGLILGYIGLSVLPILIIAAIAIPNLLRARIAANEASAVSALRMMNTACVTYNSTYGSFPRAQADLGPPQGAPPSATSAGLLDEELSQSPAIKSGYRIIYNAGSAEPEEIVGTYQIAAAPVAVNRTGSRYFFTDETGVIRVQVGAPASAHSPPLQ